MAHLLEFLIETLGSAMRGITDRIRLMLDPTFWRIRLFDKLHRFLVWLFHIRPKDDKDYYSVLWWLVSRRLVYAVVILAGIAGAFYLIWINPIINMGELGKVGRVYAYDSVPLRFESGNVRIKAKSGYIAYEGAVEGGYVNGVGNLYDENGALIYKGMFVKNRFEGDGRLYYPSGQIRYAGAFLGNLFEGEGSLFGENGVKRYDGAFSEGFMEGEGTLYNAAGSQLFRGSFHRDELVYAQLLGKSAQQLAMMYSGTECIYQTDMKSVVVLEEIDTVYCCDSGGDRIDDTLRADAVCVCRDYFHYGSQRIESLEELRAAMGKADYEGNSYATQLDVIGIDYVNRNRQDTGIDVGLETEQLFEQVRQVQSYNKDTLVYLHVYHHDGIKYTFVSKEKNGRFFLYEME